MKRVLLADDHAVVLQGLKQILQGVPDLSVEGEARTGDEALDLLRTDRWDLVILDISMPGKTTLDILRLVRHERPQLPVLILSMHSEDQFAVRMLRAGAAGYITKESAPEDLVSAVRRILMGGRYISPLLAEQLALHVQPERGHLPHDSLSDREFQVMHLMATGQTITGIADTLSLSVKTVSTYRARVLDKLKLGTNADLIHYAYKNGLIE
jgi:DNA-binding NarL/FixJ family response regulator